MILVKVHRACYKVTPESPEDLIYLRLVLTNSNIAIIKRHKEIREGVVKCIYRKIYAQVRSAFFEGIAKLALKTKVASKVTKISIPIGRQLEIHRKMRSIELKLLDRPIQVRKFCYFYPSYTVLGTVKNGKISVSKSWHYSFKNQDTFGHIKHVLNTHTQLLIYYHPVLSSYERLFNKHAKKSVPFNGTFQQLAPVLSSQELLLSVYSTTVTRAFLKGTAQTRFEYIKSALETSMMSHYFICEDIPQEQYCELMQALDLNPAVQTEMAKITFVPATRWLGYSVPVVGVYYYRAV